MGDYPERESGGSALPLRQIQHDGLPAHVATQAIEDELLLDGSPALNLSAFHNTYMEPEIESVLLRHLPKNITHHEAYPASNEIELRCVDMISNLFHAPAAQSMGVSTAGSSEAIFLSVLAAKRRWQDARAAAGKPARTPNIVMSSTVHVSWKKAALYLDIEERYVYCSADRYVLDPTEAVSLVDENTILVCAILGSTYTGEYEDVQLLDELLAAKNAKENLDVHIHIDAAAGGFVAPFVQPDLIWDFRLPLVCSINVSGHKYGMTYASVGWAIWRSGEFVPEQLRFTIDYCGRKQVSFTLNFSKPAIYVIAQYYQLLRLGISGYRAILNEAMRTATFLSGAIATMDGSQTFELISNMGKACLPLVAWRLKKRGAYDEFQLAAQLRSKGWIVPAYTLTTTSGTFKLLRVVVRQDFSMKKCLEFIEDIQQVSAAALLSENQN